jgi:hypothetical protein
MTISLPNHLRLLKHALVTLACFACAIPAANAMEMRFRYVESGPDIGQLNGISLSGPIVAGDYERFVQLIRSDPFNAVAADQVFLDSEGGSVNEALKLAGLIKELYRTTVISSGRSCLSSCFFLYVAGVERIAHSEGKLGIHRPYYGKTDSTHLSAAVAEKRYASADAQVRAFLSSVGVPTPYIEKMFSVRSVEMYYLTRRDIEKIGDYAPWYEELLIANCKTEYLRKSTAETRSEIRESSRALSKCMVRPVTSDVGKVIDRVLGDRSWRSK